jgi:hypothetical protein
MFDVPRNSDGEPIPHTIERIRCPHCNRTMDYRDSLQQYQCPGCFFSIRPDYNQTGLPAEPEEFTSRRDKTNKPPFYVKSFSSGSHTELSDEDIHHTEPERYIGSSNEALANEYKQFQSRQQDERNEQLSERYDHSDRESNQTTEGELLRFRKDRERKAAMNENK